MSPRPSRRRLADRSGFTLIEVLVAFSVLAVLLSVMYRGVVTMRAGSKAFDDRMQADIVARSVFAEALSNRALGSGTTSGLRDGRRWTITARSIDLSGSLPSPPSKASTPPVGAASIPGAPPPAAGDKPKVTWVPQRLIVSVATTGRPVVVETVRLVSRGSEQ